MNDFLKKLSDVDALVRELEEVGPLSDHDRAYIEALRRDVVARCRNVISTMRASGLRREKFEACIETANEDHAFGQTEGGEHKVVDPKSQLLRDFDVRWSAKFLMIDRVLELYPVSSFIDFCSVYNLGSLCRRSLFSSLGMCENQCAQRQS